MNKNKRYIEGLKKAQGIIARMIMENVSDVIDLPLESRVHWLDEDYEMDDIEKRFPVYCWYENQSKPQPAFICIHPEAEMQVTVSYESEINATSADTFDGTAVNVYIPADASAHEINEFIKENMDEIQSIIDSFDFTLGQFDEDAAEVVEYLQQTADEWTRQDMWAQPDADMVDVNGRLIEEFEHTFRIVEEETMEDGYTRVEIEYEDPYGQPCGGSTWMRDVDGTWQLEEDDTAPCAIEAENVSADVLRPYLEELYEAGEITVRCDEQ